MTPTALDRLRLTAATAPKTPVLAGGAGWLGAAALLKAAGGVADALRTSRRDRDLIRIGTGSAEEVLVGLLGAQLAGAVPLVADPSAPEAAAPSDADLAAAAAVVAVARETAGPESALLAVVTSATTGRPRPVVRTLASWAASVGPFAVLADVEDGDVLWAPGPLHSTLTLYACWHGLTAGMPVVAGGPWRGPGQPPVVAAAEVAVVHTVPPVAGDVLDLVPGGLLPRLRTLVVGGAHCPAAVRARATALGVRLVEYYGAAELSFVAVDADGDGLRPFAGVEVEIRDPSGRPCPPGAVGEIWVRSPYLAEAVGMPPGPTAHAAPTAGLPLRTGGWATVGDLGRRTGDVLEVVGRGDSAVDVGGVTVPVAAVEDVLRGVPDVLDVVVVGAPHPRLGQMLVGVVQAAPGTDPRPALRAAARAALPRTARPVRWLLVDDFPRTATGKVARRDLGERVARR